MLDPEVAALLERAARSGRPTLESLSPPQAREEYRRSSKILNPDPPEVGSVENRSISGPRGPIGIRLYRPIGSEATERLPALIYFHGGGFTVGDLDTHDYVCRSLANKARCAVMSVDYRLGPENKFPAAHEDAIAACRWASANANALHIDTRRLAIGGDSAGGTLSAATTLILRDAGDPRFALQLLIYPSARMPHTMRSTEANGEGYLLTKHTLNYFRSNYLNGPQDYGDWRCSPLLAPDHSQLPPALIITAGYDPLLDEGKAYAEKLAAAGVLVTYHCYEGMVHGFITMGRALSGAHQAIDECAAALRSAFAD